MQPDKTDWAIIGMLSEEHTSNTSIANELGLTEGTVRQRIKKMKESGVLRIKALRNPNLLAEQQLAILTANVAQSRLLDVKATEIEKLPNVLSVSILTGQYDLLIEVLVNSNSGVVQFLTEELTKVEGISKTETFIILKSYNKWI